MINELNNEAAHEVDDELDTTAPSSKPDQWKMPEPVFRRTSGKLPQDFEKKYGTKAEKNAESAPETDPVVNELSASENAVESTAEPKPHNPTVKLILVLLGLAAMTGFIVVFLTVVYFFIFYNGAQVP